MIRWLSGRWLALLGLLLLALAAIAVWQLHEPPVTARPALWRLSKGDRHAWLFGTIHAVPAGALWMSPAVEKAARESDWLVLEATGLAQERDGRGVFEKLGRSPALPSVTARLGPGDRARLAALFKGSPEGLRALDGYESWAAALLIGAAANQGVSQDEAGEARFEALFRKDGRRVLGLETIAAQLGAFDSLPESDQRAMLSQAVEEASGAQAQFDQLYGNWAAGHLNELEEQFLSPFKEFPHLRASLINRRNALWAQEIDRLLREHDKVLFIAVGAGHLLGPASVQARLRTLGWQVVRMQ